MPRVQPEPVQMNIMERNGEFPSSIEIHSSQKGLLEKISRFFSQIFGILTCRTNLDNLFNSREIKLLRQNRGKQLESKLAEGIPIKKVVTIETVQEEEVRSKSGDKKKYHTFDPDLEEARQFIRDLVNLILDVVHEKHIEPQISTFQQFAPSLPPIVKSTANLIIEMGDKAAKPLFKMLAQQKSQAIDPTLKKMLKTLLKPESSALKHDLYHFLQGEIRKKSLPKGIQAVHLIKSIVESLFPNETLNGGSSFFVSSNEAIDPEIEKELRNKAQSFYQTYHVDDLDRLYYQLQEKIRRELKETAGVSKQELDSAYIKPILTWLLYSDQSRPIYSLFSTVGKSEEELIDKVFESAISSLVERKIDHYVQMLDKNLQSKLPKIIESTIRANSLNIVDYFSARFSELLENLPYTQTFDHIVSQIISKQITGIISANEALNKQKNILQKAKKAAELEAFTSAQRQIKEEAQKHLLEVENQGGEEAFLHNRFIEEFSRLPCCNIHVKHAIERQFSGTSQKNILPNESPGIDNSVFSLMADEIVKLILPVKRVVSEEGHIIETDPLKELWQQMYLPEEFQELMGHVEEIASEFITPDIVSLFASVKQPLLEGIEKLIMTVAQELLKKQLLSLIKQGFSNLSLPKTITELNATQILPKINEIMLQTFVKQEIFRSIKVTGPLFQDLVLSTPLERNSVLARVQQLLASHIKSKFVQFTGKNFHVTENPVEGVQIRDLEDSEFEELLSPVILSLEESLRKKLQELGRVHPTLSVKEIEAHFKELSADVPMATNAVYGEIVLNLIFKIGGWQNEGLIGFFIKDPISKGISEAVDEFRKSYHSLVKKVISGMREFFSREAVEKILNPSPVVPLKHGKEMFKLQIETTSKIAQDMVLGLASQQGSLVSFGVKKYLGDDSSVLVQLIESIYQKLLGDCTLNENMLMQVISEIFRSFVSSAEAIKNREIIQLPHVVAPSSVLV